MGGEGAFEQYAKSGLAMAGIEFDEVDLAIMTNLYEVYGGAQRALLAHDFGQVRPEKNPDLSVAPVD